MVGYRASPPRLTTDLPIPDNFATELIQLKEDGDVLP